MNFPEDYNILASNGCCLLKQALENDQNFLAPKLFL